MKIKTIDIALSIAIVLVSCVQLNSSMELPGSPILISKNEIEKMDAFLQSYDDVVMKSAPVQQSLKRMADVIKEIIMLKSEIAYDQLDQSEALRQALDQLYAIYDECAQEIYKITGFEHSIEEVQHILLIKLLMN